MADRTDRTPLLIMEPGEGITREINVTHFHAVLSADAYEEFAVDMNDRGYRETAIAAALLSIGARLEVLCRSVSGHK